MNARASLLGLPLCLVACAAVPAEIEHAPRVRAGPVQTPERQVATKPIPVYTSDAAVLLQTGAERGSTIELHADGWLIAGTFGRHIELERNTIDWDSGPEQYQLSVVRVDARTEGILLVLPTNDAEDPPSHYRLYLRPVHGGSELVKVLDRVVGAYGAHTLWFPGDGTARYMEDGWAACDRAGHPSTPVTLHEVLLSADESGMFTEFKRIEHGQTRDCSMLAG